MSEHGLLQERVQLLRNAANFEKNKRTPIISNIFTWKVYDAGYTVAEAVTNYEVMEKCVCELHERYQFDAYLDVGTRNPMRITNALGHGFHRVDPETDAVVADDHYLMTREDYPLLRDNPMEFFWTKAFPRLASKDLTIGQFQNAIMELGGFLQFCQTIGTKLNQEYQVPTLHAGTLMVPFEELFEGLRGIRNISGDLRRCKSDMIDAMDAMYERGIGQQIPGILSSDTSAFAFDGSTSLLGHSILSEKQFGEIYWRHLGKMIEQYASHNKSLLVFCEGSIKHILNYFKDIPKGVVTIHLEQDNIFEIRKELPNIALAGGMPYNLLANGTKEQCVDYAKMLIDEMGEGFIFSTDKMLSYKNDCKRENLLAVTEFVRSYTH